MTSINSNSYLLRERDGLVEHVKEWYDPDTHSVIIEDEKSVDVVRLAPEDSADQYMNIVETPSSWCKYE